MGPWDSLEQYKARVRLACLAWLLIVGVLLCSLSSQGSDIPTDPAQAHQWADGIYAPEFDAAYNRFRATHPADRKPGSWDHVQTVNAGDRDRWAEARDRWRDLERAMKAAGY
jgi:hypothetical protein